MDDFDNPAFVFIDQAIDTFSTVDGSAEKRASHVMNHRKFLKV